MIDHQRVLTATADTVSAAAIVGSLMGYLPAIAALAAIIWYIVQIWESKTVQAMLAVRRARAYEMKKFRSQLKLAHLDSQQIADLTVIHAAALAKQTLDDAAQKADQVIGRAEVVAAQKVENAGTVAP